MCLALLKKPLFTKTNCIVSLREGTKCHFCPTIEVATMQSRKSCEWQLHWPLEGHHFLSFTTVQKSEWNKNSVCFLVEKRMPHSTKNAMNHTFCINALTSIWGIKSMCGTKMLSSQHYQLTLVVTAPKHHQWQGSKIASAPTALNRHSVNRRLIYGLETLLPTLLAVSLSPLPATAPLRVCRRETSIYSSLHTD